MSSIPLTTLTTYEAHTCANCGVQFAVTARFDKARRDDGNTFYCPAGHPLNFGETTEEKLQKKLAAAEGNLTAERERTRRAYEETQRERNRHAGTKGALTKTKKRVAGGACPCCNRSFVDLAKHMSGQHPGYVEQDVTVS